MNKAFISNLEKEIEQERIEKFLGKSKAQIGEAAFKLLVSSGKCQKPELKTKEPLSLDNLIQQETKANSFVDNFIMTKINENPPTQGEIGVQNAGIAGIGQAILEQIKAQAPVFIAKVLEEIKERTIPYALQIIEGLLEKLQDYLYSKGLESHDENEKEALRNKIIENFPDSSLAKKLKNS